MLKPEIHKFTINLLAINYNTGETIDLNKSVNAIAIHKDYMENVYPLYHISMELSKEKTQKLIKNPFYLSLKIYRVTVNQNSEINGENETPDTPITDKIITNILLRPYGKPKMYASTKENDLDEIENTEEDSKKQQLIPYSINCVPFEELKLNNKVFNSCYTGANINEILLNTVSEVYTGDIYYQESKNIKRYDSLLIPQLNLIPTIKYLQDKYLLYKNMLNIFFDDYKLFIYDIKEKDRKFNNIFNIVIEKSSGTTDQKKYSQNLIDENNNIKKVLYNNPITMDSTDISKYNMGDFVVYNSYDDNYNLVSRSYNLSDDLKKDDKKMRIHWNGNKYEYFEKSNLSLFTIFLQLSLKDIDPSLIDPDTKIIVYGSDLLSNNGEYSLLNKDIYYVSKDFINFDENITINLGKK